MRTEALIPVLVLVLAGLQACGDGGVESDGSDIQDDGLQDPADGADVPVDQADAADVPGEEGPPPPACPPQVPDDTASCDDENLYCLYMSCEDFGVAEAACAGGSWSVSTEPCHEVSCYSETCEPGEICVVMEGGALMTYCVANDCGTGPVSCTCIPMVWCDCTFQNLTFTCNTCPEGICP